MGKITKTLQPKHRESMSPWLAEYVQNATNSPLPLLPSVLDQFPSRWPLPRGDMYHWIPLLNRFDNILECFVGTYELRDAAQKRDFSNEILLQTTPHAIDFRDSTAWDMARLAELGYKEDADCQLVLAVLKFTRNLLQHCGNRSIYASSAHLSSLLNSSSLYILQAALHVGHELALRYHASYKRTSTTSRAFHTALLQNHYDISLDRVQQLALPFVKTPLAGSSTASAAPLGNPVVGGLHRTPSTPASSSHAAPVASVPPSTGKGKEKAHAESTPKTVTTMYSNDFVAIATSGPAGAAPTDSAAQGSDLAKWSLWGDIKVTYYAQHQSRSQDSGGSSSDAPDSSPSQQQQLLPHSVHDRAGHSSMPSTPTPLRRSSTMGSQLQDASSPLTPAQTRTPGIFGSSDDAAAPSGQHAVEIPSSTVQSSTVYQLMAPLPADMPSSARYEVLNRIRIAKALLGSEETRQLALAVRLLAITNLAFIHPENTFLEQVLKQDSEEPRRFQLIYQLAELIRPGAGASPVPIWLQSIALQLLESLAGFASKTNDVMSAVNASVNHGVLLYVLRKAVSDMKMDADESSDQVILHDDWRKQLFSLTLHLTAGNRMQDIVGAGLMEILVDALKVRSPVAERNYLVVVTFLDTVVLNFPTSFQPFAAAHGLDVVSQLLVDTVAAAQDAVKRGEITGLDMRCSVIDYDIPFYLQQTLKWLLKFIYHLMASSYQFGPGNDRLLRNLVDNSQLLQSLRTILENTTMFGSVVWTNAATTLSHFINHDPTSFAALSESGLIQSFLETITGRPLPAPPAPKSPSKSNNATVGDSAGGGEGGSSGGGDNNDGDVSPPAVALPNRSESDDGEGDGHHHEDEENNDDDDEDEDEDDEDRDSTLSDESEGDDTRRVPLTQEELARPRDWKLAGGILPSTEVIGSIPSILNSISLNNAGRRMVMSSGALQSYMELFESAAHVRCMETETGLATTIGTNFDELARHHPSLRPLITTAVLDMVSRVCYLAETKARDDRWGIRLLTASTDIDTVTDTDAPQASSLGGGEDVEMADANMSSAPAPASASAPAAADSNSAVAATSFKGAATPSYQDALPFITAASVFLNVYLNNVSLQSMFIKRGGIELLLDMVESPALPFIQPTAVILPTLLQIFAQILEASPILGVPAMFSRMISALDAIKPLIQPESKDKAEETEETEEMGEQNDKKENEAADEAATTSSKGKEVAGPEDDDKKTDANTSLFSIFVRPDLPTPTPEQVAAGTSTLKALFRVKCLLYLVQACFPLNRQNTSSMYPLVMFDYYKDFIERLGPLISFAMNEEAALCAAVPAHWTRMTLPALDALNSSRGSSGAATSAAAAPGVIEGPSEFDEVALADVLSNTAFTQSNDAEGTAAASESSKPSAATPQPVFPPTEKLTKQELASPTFQNFQSLRGFFHSLPPVILPDLKALGKSLMPRRERDAYMRSKHLQLAETLASMFLEQLRAQDGSTVASKKQRKFLIEAIQQLLVDTDRHTERPDGTSTPHVVVPVLLAFKKHGGFDTLNALLRSFIEIIVQSSMDRSNITTLYFAAHGMSTILDLYAVVISLKSLQESSNSVSVFRGIPERQFLYPTSSQLTMEIWDAVFPVITELWQSPVLEKISTSVLSRLVEIMKTITTSNLQNTAFSRTNRPKTSPTAVFDTPPVAFPWNEHQGSIARVQDRDIGLPESLVAEALYRANGSVEFAVDYGRAVRDGLTRNRHPIPASDARPSPSATPAANAAAPTEGGSGGAPRLPFPLDAMALDNPRNSEDLLIENLLSEANFSVSPAERPASGSGEAGSASKKDDAEAAAEAAASTVVAKEDIEEKRAELRKDLIDRCLAVIQMHPDAVQDIADLVSASVLKSADPESNTQEEVGETLTEALISFAIDDENKKENAASISAYAYLLCLLINQSSTFFDSTAETLRNNIDELLGFLVVPQGTSPEDLPPWLSHFFLLFEILLIKDEEETHVDFKMPSFDDEPDSYEVKDLVYESRTYLLTDEHRSTLLNLTLDILPRIGKDESLAVSVSRVVQIMTRRHDVAKTVGDKKNLQRLFLMAKQLSGIGSAGFSDTRLSVYILTTLRHIVEDTDVLRQIMTFEIRLFFENALLHRNQRSQNLVTFLELFSNVALRNRPLFISVLGDLVKITRLTQDSIQQMEYNISLKDTVTGRIEGGAGASSTSSHDDSFGPAVQATQELNINDVRPSTETDAAAGVAAGQSEGSGGDASSKDKDMPDAPAKPAEAVTAVVEHKRPVVENPDGVITFLLEQLMTYQKVDDAEVLPAKDAANKDKDAAANKGLLGTDIPTFTAAPTPDPAESPFSPPAALSAERDAAASAATAAATAGAAGSGNSNSKDKDKAVQGFRTSDHPIFVFRAFLISCLSELLRSYSRSKMEFINFKRGVALQTLTPVKPRTSVLNYLLNDILCAGSTHSGGLYTPPETVADKKKAALADQARRLLTALVEKTPERYVERTRSIYEFDDDSDLQFVRRFVLDTILKAYKEAAGSSIESIDVRYGKMAALGELMSAMIGADKERTSVPYAESHSHMQLRRLMFEKGFLAALTHSIADVDLAFPGAKRTLKHVLRVLNVLTATAIDLSRANIISSTGASQDAVEYDIMSTSSLSDMEDDREETPDLYRNSSLGMLEGGNPDDEDYSDSDHEDEMYDDEMDYDDEITDDGEDPLSDEDDEEMGPVEGMHGEPGVVELVMDDGEEDEEDDEDSEGSEDMEDIEEQIDDAIEELGEDDIMEDDGASDWESDSEGEGDEDDGFDGDDGYDVDPHHHHHGHLHQVQIHVPDADRLGHLDDIVRNMNAGFGGDDVEIDNYDDPYIEEGAEEDEEDEDDDGMDEDEYIYDQDYPHDDSMAHDDPAGMAWDPIVEPHRHHHVLHSHGGHPGGGYLRHHRFGADFSSIFRSDRAGRQAINDGVNPMLRRSHGGSRDGNRPASTPMFRLGLPTGLFTSAENPMAILNELVSTLPAIGRGHSLQFQITQGPHGEIRELSMPVPHEMRHHHDSRHGESSRRGADANGNTEPAQAIAFRTATTIERWTAETRMVFGSSPETLVRPLLFTHALHRLIPPAFAEALKERARKREIERQEAERKEREEKEKKEREAKEAEERARKLAEEEKAAAALAAEEAAAAEALADARRSTGEGDEDEDKEAGDDDNTDNNRGDRDTSEPMEGVETAADVDAGEGSSAGAGAVSAASTAAEPAQPQPRVMAIIRGAEMDITDLGIDPEYLEALPEEFREEVIAQALTARRSEARQQAETTGEQADNYNEFLEALPDDLRMDIVQQEQQDSRRRAREAERRQAGGGNNAAGGAGADNAAQEEMDTASILMSFPPQLRNEILREQGEELFDRLPPEMAAHARNLLELDQERLPPQRAPRLRDDAAGGHHGHAHPERSHIFRAGGPPGGARAGEASGVVGGQGNNGESSSAPIKIERRPVVQMMDRSGVATLLRLMFVTQHGTTRTCLFNLFIDLCQNRQSRLEIISTMLQILQDGSTDIVAVERCFNQLSAKARQPPKDSNSGGNANANNITGSKDVKATPGAVTATPGTGGSLKRSMTNTSLAPTSSFTNLASQLPISPLMVVLQGLDLLVDLCNRNQHIPALFLSEHDFVGYSLRKPFGGRKAKGVQSKASRFGINALLLLLEKDLVMESPSAVQLLAELLNRVTQPLQTIERERRRRELDAEQKRKRALEASKKDKETAADDNKDASASVSAAAATEGGDAAAAAEGSSSAAPADDKKKAEDATDNNNATTDQNKLKDLMTPFIPDHNLSLVVNIFVARECSSKTFQNTISTIKNLSCIQGTKQRFGQELARQAKTLSDNILVDLDNLLPYIEAAETGTEIQGIALAKFSPGAAEQNKLLRVLTALDHLFGVQAKDKDDAVAASSTIDEEDYMGSLYHNATFIKMWGRLSACLSAIRQRDSMLNVATILLPLIESLMVVCKNATLPEAAAESQMSQSMTLPGKDSKDKEKEKEDSMLLLSSPPPESRPVWDLFFRFTEEHRRILNELVRNNPKLMSGTFSLLVKNPKVLEFDNKRNYFNRSVHAKTQQQHQRPSFPPLQLSVRRDQVFHDSFRSLYFKSGDEMKYGKLNIRFHGEEGVDAGGVTREWFQVLSRQMFDPNYALFIPVSSDRTTFHPNKLSGINDEHLLFFKFIGRVIGKALYEGRLLECYFSRAVYKRILGKPVSVKDMESFDPEYYKSLVWMLENDITDVITETFSVVDDEFGATKVVDLIPNGRDVAVTEENKHDYVRLVVEHKLLASVKDQMGEFLKGFHDIIPAELISIFTEQELELLISGLPDIDVDDWRGNTEYHNYSGAAPQIQWFWRAVRSFDKEERAKLLQFVTGTSKVPLNGFKELEGMNGVNRFNIHRDYGNKDRLPSSHTCFNQLDLPEYESYDAMRSQLLKAITAGNEYFGFA
ncbi:E3 ubiquitin-protein ligase tom1 [Sporothrix bragantina]|uniref:HECT-type E3 ubiquitin transferase n=1 Tax=Sporothrix bragantina TaxID=671064 RepID=A0ABP0BCB1_9PEZI